MLAEDDLKKYIGSRIKQLRNKRGMTQQELGDKLGVRNNTISAYERGSASPDSDALFLLSEIFEVKIDDFFPPIRYKEPYLHISKNKIPTDLAVDDMHFLQKLLEKTLSLEGEERERFLDSIRFTVAYYGKDLD